MAHFGLNLRLLSYALRQRLRGVLRSLRIFLALAFEVLVGILLAVNAVWDAMLIYVVWRCILFVQASHRCSSESTTELKKNGEQKRFRASAELALESLSEENAALCRRRKETALALHGRSYPLCPAVHLLAANACGYGLDLISHSSATTLSASSDSMLTASFPLNSSGELATHPRDAFRAEDCASELCALSSLLQLSVENITSLPTSPSTFALLIFEGTRFDAVQLSMPERICASLHSISGELPHCVTATYPSQSNEAKLDATSMSGWDMHRGVLEADQLIVVKDPVYSVMGGVHMNWLAGILSISRYDGVVLTRNLNKWMSVTVISSFQPKSTDERFPAMAKLALQKSFRGCRARKPARRSSSSKENFDKLELHESQGSRGDSFKSLHISIILRAPPMPAVNCIEVVDSKQQACISLSAAETLQEIGEENEQKLPLQQTWWDEDAVLLGEEICDGFEQWKPLPKCRKKSLFSVCKSAMTSLASSISSKSTR